MRSIALLVLSVVLVGCSLRSFTTSPSTPIISPPPPIEAEISIEVTSTHTPEAEAIPFAQSLPKGSEYGRVRIIDGFTRPLDVQDAGDGRLFIVEQPGLIWILEDSTRRPDPCLDVQALVNDNARSEIWSSGLRNPWRFAFGDAADGSAYLVDRKGTIYQLEGTP